MTSFFQRARQSVDEEPQEEISPVFKQIKEHKKQNIIPPVGIAEPELVESFQKNLENEDQILKDIQELEEYKRETPFETGKREVLAHGARASEGFWGGIGSFINTIVPDMEFPGIESEESEGKFKKSQLPTASDFRELTKKRSGKYLEPKSGITQASNEVLSDIGSMFSTPWELSFLQKIAVPIGGQIFKQAIKAGGGGDTAQEVGKLGFMTMATMANLGNAQKVAGQAIRDAEAMIAPGVTFSAKPTENVLQKIKNSSWFKTGRTPSKGPAMDEISRIEGMIKNGQFDAHEVMQLRRDLNEARKGLKAFSLTPVPDKKAALKYIDDVDDALRASMENYGKNVNPQWWKNYNSANEAFKITQRSRQLSEFLSLRAKPLQSETAKILFHVGGSTALTHLPAVAAASVPIAASLKTIQIMNRMIRSPVLRNHYLDVVRATATGNAAVIDKALDSFDKKAKALEKKKSDQSSS